MKNPLKYGLRHALYTLLCAVLSSSFIGFALIFISIWLFGHTEFMSWQMFVQIVMVAAGGSLISNSGSKS